MGSLRSVEGELLSEQNGHSKPVVIGVDPSIRSTGVCWNRLASAAIKYDKNKVLWGGEQRIQLITAEIINICRVYESDLVVIEDILNTGKNAGNAIINGMLQGAIRYKMMSEGFDYLVVNPTTLKKFATGKGNADKTAMALAAYQRDGIEFNTSDECDAWWLRQFGMAWHMFPEIELPKAQMEQLDKARYVG